MTVASLLFDIVIGIHVATGFVGLAAFWVPIFARKGGRLHVRAGRVYAYCAYVVTVSAVTVAAGRIVSYQVQGIGLTDRPDLYGFALFLGYLGVMTFATVRQAVRVVETRRTPEKLRTPFHEGLAWAVDRRQRHRRRLCAGGVVRALADPAGAQSDRPLHRAEHAAVDAQPGSARQGLVLQPPRIDARPGTATCSKYTSRSGPYCTRQSRTRRCSVRSCPA